MAPTYTWASWRLVLCFFVSLFTLYISAETSVLHQIAPNTKALKYQRISNADGSTQRRLVFFFFILSLSALGSRYLCTFLSSLFLCLLLPLSSFLSMAYFSLLRFSTFRLYGPRPSSSFTSHRPDEATNPTTSPRCRFSFLALRPCSSTRVPKGMGAEGEGEAVGVADDDGADACCCRRRCACSA